MEEVNLRKFLQFVKDLGYDVVYKSGLTSRSLFKQEAGASHYNSCSTPSALKKKKFPTLLIGNLSQNYGNSKA